MRFATTALAVSLLSIPLLAAVTDARADDTQWDARIGLDMTGFVDTNAVLDIQLTHAVDLGPTRLYLGVYGQEHLTSLIKNGEGRPIGGSLTRIGPIARFHPLPKFVFDPWIAFEVGVAVADPEFPESTCHCKTDTTYADVAGLIGFDVHFGPAFAGLHAQVTTSLGHPFDVAENPTPNSTPTDHFFPYIDLGAHLGMRF